MSTSNNFLYVSTVKNFLDSIKKNRIDEIIKSMCERAQESGMSCGESEVKSWKSNFAAMSQLLRQSEVADDAVIGFEYKIPIGGRIDCVLLGYDSNGIANMIHIELKQWSNSNVSEHYSGYTFCTDIILDGARQSKYTSHPSAQAHEYHNHILNYIEAFEKHKINLYGFAFCYNYLSTNSNSVLCDNTYAFVTQHCPLYCKDQMEDFAKELKVLIGAGKGNDILDKIVNSKVKPTKRLQDVAKTMFDVTKNNEEFSLIGKQLDAYNSILGAILKNDKENKKTVVVVKGGPGTGKSVIAMRLIAGLAKSEQFRNIFYATRSTSLINGYTEILKGVGYRNGGDSNAIDLLKKNVKIKPYFNDDCNGESWIDALVVDEAHRIEKYSNDQNDTNKRCQTHLSQIMNMLFSSRVSIFFIDDYQSVKGIEIGSSENIKNAALGYYQNILKENDAYCKGTKGAYHGGIPALSEKIEKAEKKFQDVKKVGDDKKIREAEKVLRSLEGELKYANQWIKDATPSDVKVNYMEFELEDQFRCNGSNNYIDWLECALYNADKKSTTHLDRTKYEFEVFDSPTKMYEKVREMDDFGRFADEMLKKGYTYDEVLEKARDMKFNQRARLLAGWCWEWKQKDLEKNGDLLHEIKILEEDGSEFSLPWETLKSGRKPTGIYKNMYAPSADVWLNNINGINQTGCIHSAQGWEVDYVGVIIAGDIKYDPENDCLCSNEAVKNEDSKVPKSGIDRDRIIKNIYRVLMTRGKKGCYIYACDPEVRDYFKRMLNN